MTQFNLRNLLFGSYLPGEDGSYSFGEITGFDQFEKSVSSKIKEHQQLEKSESAAAASKTEDGNDDGGGDNKHLNGGDLSILPIRYSLEIVSHVHRIISTPGGHAVIGGNGGEGRRSVARLAAFMTNHVFFSLPISKQYNRDDWRFDLKRLIRMAGSENKEIVIFIPAVQLLEHAYLMTDVDSLFARGEVPGLFSLEEKHQLNEFVHKHLMKEGGGKVSEMTPSALYEIFIEISRSKLHIVITYNYNHPQIGRMLRKHKSILNEATQLNLKVNIFLKTF